MIADVKTSSLAGGTGACILDLDGTPLDSQTLQLPADANSSWGQFVLQGQATGVAGTVNVSCSGATFSFSQFHIQALEVRP